jgi:hypothetical protein
MNALSLKLVILACEASVVGAIVSGCVGSSTSVPMPQIATTLLPNASTANVPPATVSPAVTRPQSTATPTSLATLSSEEARRLFFASLKNNGGCRLPCWWNIIPGQTPIDAVRISAARFGDLTVMNELESKTGRFLMSGFDGDRRVDVDVSYGPLQSGKVEWLDVSNSLYLKIDGSYQDTPRDSSYYYQAYTIAELLSTYGKPASVLLGGDADRKIFSLSTVYPEKGIWVEYAGDLVSSKDGLSFKVYPMQASIHVWLWQTGKYTSIDDLRSSSVPILVWGEHHQSIEKMTHLTLDEFYDMLKEAKRDSYFETPKRLWATN